MRGLLRKFVNTKFDLQVWLMAVVVGGLRVFMALVEDAGKAHPHVLEIVVDVIIFLFFALLCGLIYKRKLTTLHPSISLILLILVAINFIQFGGVRGGTEYNLMTMSIFLILVHDRKWLAITLPLYGIVVIGAMVDVHYQGWFTQNLFIRYSTSPSDFIYTALVILIMMNFFKKAMIRESTRLHSLQTELKKHIYVVSNQNDELEAQRYMLREVNQHLENEIERHTQNIVQQNAAIRNYIRLTTRDLDEPLQQILISGKELNHQSPLCPLLKQSIAELYAVIDKLKNDLNEKEQQGYES